MKTLRDYLSNATHYVFPDESLGGAERQRERFISYCERNGLDRKFSQLVEENAEWRELAEKQQVAFFEYLPKRPLGVYSSVKPDIRLICVQLGTIPAIKLIIETDY